MGLLHLVENKCVERFPGLCVLALVHVAYASRNLASCKLVQRLASEQTISLNICSPGGVLLKIESNNSDFPCSEIISIKSLHRSDQDGFPCQISQTSFQPEGSSGCSGVGRNTALLKQGPYNPHDQVPRQVTSGVFTNKSRFNCVAGSFGAREKHRHRKDDDPRRTGSRPPSKRNIKFEIPTCHRAWSKY